MKTKVLFIYVVPYGQPAWELNTLYALTLKQYGIESAFLAPGIEPDTEQPVPVYPFRFHDFRLDAGTKKFILDFAPDVIHLCSPRFLPCRVALEAMVLTNAALVVKHEDDELFIATQDYITVSPRPAFQLGMTATLTPDRLRQLFASAAWPFLFKEWLSKPSLMLAEPVSFTLVNHLASGLIGIWDHVAADLAATYCKPTHVMPPTLDVGSIKPGAPDINEIREAKQRLNLPDDKTILLFSGKYYALMYDFDLMLKTLGMPGLRDDPSWHLCVTGNNPHVERHQAIVREAGIADRITWLGNLSKSDLNLVARRADITLSFGLIDGFNRSRLPQKNVMYMAYGKPMLTFGCGFGESLHDGQDALLVQSDEPADWATKLTQLLKDKSLCERLGRNAREFALQRFDCRAIAEGLAAFYRSIHMNRSRDLSLLPDVSSKGGDRGHLCRETLSTREFQSCRRVVIFGAGKHTIRLLQSEAKRFLEGKDVMIADEKPQRSDVDGIPVIPWSDVPSWNPDGIILSTDTFEDQMQQRCLQTFKQGPMIFRLYTPPHVVHPVLESVVKRAAEVRDTRAGASLDIVQSLLETLASFFGQARIVREQWTDAERTVREEMTMPLHGSALTSPLWAGSGSIHLIEVHGSGLAFAKHLDALESEGRADAFVIVQRSAGGAIALLWQDFKNITHRYVVSEWQTCEAIGFAVLKTLSPTSKPGPLRKETSPKKS